MATVAIASMAGFAACGGDESAEVAVSGVEAASTVAPERTVATTEAPPSRVYVVAAGDSLSAIADQFCVGLDELVAANGWPDGAAHPIFPGDDVSVPAAACGEQPGAAAPDSASAPQLSVDDVATLTPAPPWAPIGQRYEQGAWHHPYNPFTPSSELPWTHETAECIAAWEALRHASAPQPSRDGALADALAALPDAVPADVAAAAQFETTFNQSKELWAELLPRFYANDDPARTLEYRQIWEPLEQPYLDQFIVQEYLFRVCPQVLLPEAETPGSVQRVPTSIASSPQTTGADAS
jgi:LysM repeat protein